MPHGFSINVNQLVRVLLNDPSVRAEIYAALEAGPSPVRNVVGNHEQPDGHWDVFVRTDREREPGQKGFLARDDRGHLTTTMREAMQSDAEAPTLSITSVAETLGMTVEELARLTKPP